MLFAGALILMCIPVTLRELAIWSFYEVTPFWEDNGFSGGINIGTVQAMQYLPGIIVQPFAGKFCDWLGSARVVVATFVLMGLGFVFLGGTSPVILWTGLFLFGVGASSSTVASETFMASLASTQNRSLVYGVGLTVGIGLGGLMAGVSGWVVDSYGRDVLTGYRIWFVMTGLALMISTSLYMFMEKLRTRYAAGNFFDKVPARS